MSRIPLPVEICQYIVQYADFSDLPALALVQRALQESAEMRLYQTLSIVHSPFTYDLFNTIIRTPRLGPLVKNLQLFRESGRDVNPTRQAYNDRLIMNNQYWVIVREALKAMSGLKSLTLMDPTLRNSWVLDPTETEVEMVQDDQDGGFAMREVVRENYFDFKLRELRIFVKWDENASAFVQQQDQLRRLQVMTSRSGTHGLILPQPLPNADTQTLRNLSIYEGPLGVTPYLYACPILQMKLTLELLDGDEIDESEFRETCRSLRGLDNFKNLRVLAIVGIPFDGYDTRLRYETARNSRALLRERRRAYNNMTEEDNSMDSDEDNSWALCVDCIKAVTAACPNLEYLGYVPLIVDGKGVSTAIILFSSNSDASIIARSIVPGITRSESSFNGRDRCFTLASSAVWGVSAYVSS